MTRKLEIPKIESHERTPLVDQLIEIINEQKKEIDKLAEEVKRLKGHKGKPKLKPSAIGQNKKKNQVAKQESNAKKQKKKPNIVEIIKVEGLPEKSRFKGYRNYEVQELIIKVNKILYKLERWQLPDGKYKVAKLPKEIIGFHFGHVLRAYILHQYHHQGVTQPLLLTQLHEWGVEISKGELNNLLVNDKDDFHNEKEELLKAALSASSYINVDDTGARHKGKNGYCTHIGNELFAWFKSTESKSRINFLELLRQNSKEYYLAQESFAYMERYKVAPWIRNKLKPFKWMKFKDKETWEMYLKYWGIKNKHYKRLVTEGALIGSVLKNGFPKNTVIVSDDAGQFNVFKHALCWIHAERNITALIPSGEKQISTVEWARGQIWEIYNLLLEYKKAPSKKVKQQIEEQFDTFSNKKTDYQTLNLVLKKWRVNKKELLMALENPEIPLHNNLSERDIREYVKRRKINGSTRSDSGMQCRDTFASLKKTANKLKITFWDYLIDRLTDRQKISWLPDLIIQMATNNSS